MSRIAVLTSGGDSPGMNSAVTSIARTAAYYGLSLIGIKRGYNGLLGLSDGAEDDVYEMNLDTVLDLADLPGTYLRTARCSQFLDPKVREEAARNLKQLDVIGLVVIIHSFAVVQRSIYTAAIDFKTLAKISFTCALVSGAVGLYMAYSGFGVWTLVGQQLTRAACSAILLWWYSSWRPKLIHSW